MRRKSINVPGIHHGDQPIPQASVVGNILISGGVLGMDPEDGKIPEDINLQCKLMFENIHSIMENANGSMEDIARITVFLSNMENRHVVNDEWIKCFPDEESRPARLTIKRDLPGKAHIQCEIFAVLQDQ